MSNKMTRPKFIILTLIFYVFLYIVLKLFVVYVQDLFMDNEVYKIQYNIGKVLTINTYTKEEKENTEQFESNAKDYKIKIKNYFQDFEAGDKDITYKDALLIGLYQAVAIVPGISRSGMTLVGCLLNGFNNKTSLKYSFMLYLPVSLGTMISGFSDFKAQSADISLILYYIVGMIAAGVLTYLSYNWLTKIVEKGKLWRFSIYLFAAAIFTIMLFI